MQVCKWETKRSQKSIVFKTAHIPLQIQASLPQSHRLAFALRTHNECTQRKLHLWPYRETHFNQFLILLDPDTKAIVDGWANELDAVKSEVVGETLVTLDGERTSCRLKECNLGKI